MTKTGTYTVGEVTYKQEWYKKNKKKVLDYNREKKYGITREAYSDMFDKQQGLCALCSSACVTGRLLAVDHNHITGKIRALLCHHCNTALGGFREDIDLLQKAIDYLRAYE